MPLLAKAFKRISPPSAIWPWALAGLGILVLTSPAGAQFLEEFTSTPVPEGEGWGGFTRGAFLLNAFLNLSLAAVLGAVIAYHPRRTRTADTLEEVEARKVSIVYAVIGSLIGILVMRYGMEVGVVLFGFGTLIRFRTAMRSPQLTGQVIFGSLVGLMCGLDQPHVAVLATVFDFVLIFILEARITYRVDVRGLQPEIFAEAADAYRAVLAGPRYHVLSETKRPGRGRISFIFRIAGRHTQEEMEEIFERQVDPALRGSLDWEVD